MGVTTRPSRKEKALFLSFPFTNDKFLPAPDSGIVQLTLKTAVTNCMNLNRFCYLLLTLAASGSILCLALLWCGPCSLIYWRWWFMVLIRWQPEKLGAEYLSLLCWYLDSWVDGLARLSVSKSFAIRRKSNHLKLTSSSAWYSISPCWWRYIGYIPPEPDPSCALLCCRRKAVPSI